MANNRLGELRRSTVIMTFGPGSIVDFRANGAPVSAVAAGLEEWDRSFKPAGLRNHQKISEPRLQRKLSVGGFRLPPVAEDNQHAGQGKEDNRALVAVRFPEWLQCPQCNRLAPADQWSDDPGLAYRYCADCTNNTPGLQMIFVIPVPFVMACPKGHLDDFPWHVWVSHKASCPRKENSDLYLRSVKPGLTGLVLSCNDCGAQRSMDGVFSSQTWSGFQCRGRRPWLAAKNEKCDCEPRTLQRGASNLYFPVIVSALSIPPWSDEIQEALGTHWNTIVSTKPKDRRNLIRILVEGELELVIRELNLTSEELAKHIEDRLNKINDDDILNIYQEEYRQFVIGSDTLPGDAREFEVRNVPVPEKLNPFFNRILRVVRLREVRALMGFTRINPPGDQNSQDIAAISVSNLDWLPGIEVRGEGIFLAFNTNTLHAWESKDIVVARAKKIDDAWRAEWYQRYGEGEPPQRITPRYLLVHTFAHALMRQLTLECGYSTASLRERLYVGDGPMDMAGLLIYTATSDSDGTLGGLQRQGEAHRLERAVQGAIRSMEWCSSDPLCIEGLISGADHLSFAACHACVLAPETACEEHNRFLDRATLVGLPGNHQGGFFSVLLSDK